VGAENAVPLTIVINTSPCSTGFRKVVDATRPRPANKVQPRRQSVRAGSLEKQRTRACQGLRLRLLT